jgi:hypothetical protein
MVRDLLHLRILEVTSPETEHRQEGLFIPALFDQADHLGVTRRSHLEVAVAHQDHTVVSAVHVMSPRHVVRQP